MSGNPKDSVNNKTSGSVQNVTTTPESGKGKGDGLPPKAGNRAEGEHAKHSDGGSGTKKMNMSNRSKNQSMNSAPKPSSSTPSESPLMNSSGGTGPTSNSGFSGGSSSGSSGGSSSSSGGDGSESGSNTSKPPQQGNNKNYNAVGGRNNRYNNNFQGYGDPSGGGAIQGQYNQQGGQAPNYHNRRHMNQHQTPPRDMRNTHQWQSQQAPDDPSGNYTAKIMYQQGVMQGGQMYASPPNQAFNTDPRFRNIHVGNASSMNSPAIMGMQSTLSPQMAYGQPSMQASNMMNSQARQFQPNTQQMYPMMPAHNFGMTPDQIKSPGQLSGHQMQHSVKQNVGQGATSGSYAPQMQQPLSQSIQQQQQQALTPPAAPSQQTSQPQPQQPRQQQQSLQQSPHQQPSPSPAPPPPPPQQQQQQPPPPQQQQQQQQPAPPPQQQQQQQQLSQQQTDLQQAQQLSQVQQQPYSQMPQAQAPAGGYFMSYPMYNNQNQMYNRGLIQGSPMLQAGPGGMMMTPMAGRGPYVHGGMNGQGNMSTAPYHPGANRMPMNSTQGGAGVKGGAGMPMVPNGRNEGDSIVTYAAAPEQQTAPYVKTHRKPPLKFSKPDGTPLDIATFRKDDPNKMKEEQKKEPVTDFKDTASQGAAPAPSLTTPVASQLILESTDREKAPEANMKAANTGISHQKLADGSANEIIESSQQKVKDEQLLTAAPLLSEVPKVNTPILAILTPETSEKIESENDGAATNSLFVELSALSVSSSPTPVLAPSTPGSVPVIAPAPTLSLPVTLKPGSEPASAGKEEKEEESPIASIPVNIPVSRVRSPPATTSLANTSPSLPVVLPSAGPKKNKQTKKETSSQAGVASAATVSDDIVSASTDAPVSPPSIKSVAVTSSKKVKELEASDKSTDTKSIDTKPAVDSVDKSSEKETTEQSPSSPTGAVAGPPDNWDSEVNTPILLGTTKETKEPTSGTSARRSLRPGGSGNQLKLNQGTMPKRYTKEQIISLKPLNLVERGDPKAINPLPMYASVSSGGGGGFDGPARGSYALGMGGETHNKPSRVSSGASSDQWAKGQRKEGPPPNTSDSMSRTNSRERDMQNGGGDGSNWGSDRGDRSGGSGGSGGSGSWFNRKDRNNRTPTAPPKKVITDPFEIVCTEVLAILNKITPQTLEKLSIKTLNLPITNTSMLDKLIEHIFEKAVQEQTFTGTYAELCEILNGSSKWIFYTVVKDMDSKEYFWIKDFEFEPTLTGPYNTQADAVSPFTTVDLNNPPPTMALQKSGVEESMGGSLDVEEVFLFNTFLVKLFINKSTQEYYTSWVYFNDIENEKKSENFFQTAEEARKDGKSKNNFRSRLVNICQNEFQMRAACEARYHELERKRTALIENAKKTKKTGDDEIEVLQNLAAIDEERTKLKRRMLGNIRFVGELYKKGMLSTSVMHGCVSELLKDGEGKWKKMDEQDVELLCKLMLTVGHQLFVKSSSKQEGFLNSYFDRLSQLSKDKTLSPRMRFSIEEVISFRKNNWTARRVQEGPLKIAEIHQRVQEEERREEERRQSEDQRGGHRSASGSSSGGYGGGGNSVPRIVQRNNSSDARNTGRVPPASGGRSGQTSTPTNRSARDQLSAGSSAGRGGDNCAFSLNDEEITKKVKSACNEYMRIADDAEFTLLLNGAPQQYFTRLVVEVAEKCVDVKTSEMSKLVAILNMSFVSQALSGARDVVLPALSKIESLQCLYDTMIDSRNAPENFGIVFAALVNIKMCNPRHVKELISKVKEKSVALDLCTKEEVKNVFSKLESSFANNIR